MQLRRGNVSIRRADRCLVEAQVPYLLSLANKWFQSAVRIAVWLKSILSIIFHVFSTVSIRRADRCLVEVKRVCCRSNRFNKFQSAVRIAVWLK